MKKIAWAFVALTLIGCKVDEREGTILVSDVKTVYSGTLENRDTKVYVDSELNLHWNADDEISVFSTTANLRYGFDGETGDREGTFSLKDDAAVGAALPTTYGVYPYQESTSIDTKGTLTLDLPAVQYYKDRSFSPGANTMVAVARDNTSDRLAFQNLCGFVVVQLFGEATVTSVQLMGNDGEELSGQGSVTPSYGEAPALVMSKGAGERITLDCGEGVTLGQTEAEATSFWFVVPPVSFSQGFTITVTDTETRTWSKRTTAERIVVRNVKNSLSPIKVSPLSVTFDEADLVVMPANSSRDIHYTIVSESDDITIETMASNGIETEILKTDATTGAIRIQTGAVVEADSRVVVLVSNGAQAIMKTLFVGGEATIEVENNTTMEVPDEGGTLELEFFSDAPAHIIIPEEAKGWISLASETRASEQHPLSVAIQANDGPARSAIVRVVGDGDASYIVLDYTIEQEAAGSGPGETVPPDNEIWYTTTSGRIINASTDDFGANLISNTYVEGKGIMAFDGPVTRVPAHAFSNFDDDESATLLTISFPLSLKTIGECAFYRTLKLCWVDLPESLEYIGSQAFFYTALEELHLPDQAELGGNISVCNSKMRAFYSKYASDDRRCLVKDGTLLSFAPAGLTEYVVPEGITRLGYRCFIETPELSDVRMPSTLQVIENDAFDGSGLIHAVVPEGVVSIGDWAFRGNAKLESISFPNSLQELGQTVVGMCPNLTAFLGKFSSSDGKCLIVDGELLSFAQKGVLEYTIPNEVSVIGEDVFWNNDIIRKMTVSEGVKEIKRGAFYSCDALESIYMPGSLEKIGSRVLAASSSLQAVLGPHASPDGRCFIFKGKLVTAATRGLTTYVLPEGIKEIGANSIMDTYLKELYIPEGVETIDQDAFRICPRLEMISIPSTVTSIGDYDNSMYELFYSCPSLSRVLLKAKIPPALQCPLRGNSTIYVYNDALESYLQDPEWSKYAISGVDSFEEPDDLYESTDYSQDGKTVVLQKATKGAGIDVFILGDAFSDRLIASGRYESVMRKAYSHLFSEEPYKSFQEYFNVYMVYAVSKNEVYSTFSKTALGTYFGEGTFIGGNTDVVWNYVYRTPIVSSNNTLAVVVLNTERYAGTCSMYNDYDGYDYGCGDAIAYCPLTNSDDLFRDILLHEAFGHGFAKLDDEYEQGMTISETDIQWKYESPFRGGWYKNVDVTDNPLTIKWKDFLSDARYAGEGIGIFEGGGTFSYGTWRPTEDSIMRNSGSFNAPSRQAIWYRINKLAYGDSWEGTYEDFVAFDRVSRTAEAAARRKTYHSNSVGLLPPLAPPVVIERSVSPN